MNNWAGKVFFGVLFTALLAHAADDTAMLQELFATEGDVVVPAGNYTVSGQLTVDNASTVRGATGDPKDVTITLTGTSAAHLLYVNHADAVVSGLTLVGGQGVGASEADGNGRNTRVTAGVVSNCVMRGASIASPANKQYATVVCVNGANAVITHSIVSNNAVTGYNNSTGSKDVSPGVRVANGGRFSYSLVAYNRDTGTRNYSDTTMKDAAGVTVEGGSMDHCVVAYNEARHVGGVRLVGNSSTATKCLIFGNKSNYRGVAYDETQGTASQFVDSSIAPADLCEQVVDLDGGDYRSAPGGALAAADIGLPFVPAATPYVGVRASADRTIVPANVTLFPSLVGLSGVVRYRWNFGDGSEVVETAEALVGHCFTATGKKTVTLTVLGASDAVLGSVTREIVFLPQTRTVSTIADLQEAVAESVSGCTVALAAGTYAVTTEMRIEKGVRVVGATGKAEDVKLQPAKNIRAFYLSDAAAFLGNLTVEDTVVSATTCQGMGFLIDRRGGTVSNVVIRGMTFSGTLNSQSWQSSAAAIGTSAFVTHTVVSNNHSTAASGSQNNYLRMAGIDLHEGATLANSLIARNVVDPAKTDSRRERVWAGGVWGEKANLVNCTIVGNYAVIDAGGVYLQAGSAINCVVAGNTSNAGTGYNDIYPGSDSRFTSSLIGANTGEIFVKYEADDFTPASGKALHDTGTEQGVSVPAKDLIGNDRISGVAIDIGCLELDMSQKTLTFSTPKTELVSPATVTFTAAPTGFDDPTDDLWFYWDFDNDGVTDEVTSELSVSHRYSSIGRVSVSLTMTNKTTKAALTKTEPNYLYFVPPVMYVDATSETEAFPYDQPSVAASNVQTAVDAAMDGVTILLASGDYSLTTAVSVAKGVTIRNPTGNPEDVRFANPVTARNFYLNHGDAKLESVVLTGGKGKGEGRNLYIDNLGGTVSNCVLRNGRITLPSVSPMQAGDCVDFIVLKGRNALLTHSVVTNNAIFGRCSTSNPGNYMPGVLLMTGGRIENSLVAYNDHSVTNSDYRCHVGYAAGIGGNGFIVNCTVVSNRSVEAGGICFRNAGSYDAVQDSFITNTVVAGNICVNPNYVTDRAAFTERLPPDDPDTADARTRGLSANSVFGGDVEALFKGFEQGNFKPRTPGPLVGTGTTVGLAVPETDLSGAPRVRGRKIDIGALEGDPTGLMLLVR